MMHGDNQYVRTINYADLETMKITGTENYLVQESNLLYAKHYYVSFKWTNKDKNYQPQDFYYDAAWHVDHPGVGTRVYEFSTFSTWSLYSGASNTFLTGTTMKYKPDGTENPAYASASITSKVDEENRRMMRLVVKSKIEPNNIIKGYKVYIKADRDGDGTYESEWADFEFPLSETRVENGLRVMETTYSIDPKPVNNGGEPGWEYFDTNIKYTTEFQAYYDCPDEEIPNDTIHCSGGRKYTTRAGVPFTYYMAEPTISIIRYAPAGSASLTQSNVFSLRITINDKYRAIGDYSYVEGSTTEVKKPAVYTLKIIADGETHSETITSNNPSITTTYDDIRHCENAQNCKVEIEYAYDKNNGNPDNTVNTTIEKEINTNYIFDLGTVSQGAIKKDEVKITFKNSFNLNTNLKLYDFTFVSDMYGQISESSKTATITGTSTKYLTIAVPSPFLRADVEYALSVNFYTVDGILLGSFENDNVIYTTST
jgi:hypothetical protein